MDFQNFRTYEFKGDTSAWFNLDDVLRLTELTDSDIQKALEAGDVSNIKTLLDGTRVIREDDAYYFIFFVSNAPAVRASQNWLFDKVLPEIMTKGYYIKGA